MRSLLLALTIVPALVFAQGDPAVIAKIIDEGKNHNQVTKHLRHLTKNIGPRLTGSPRYQKAAEWCAKQFTRFGLKNVQLENAVEVPVPFDRGRNQSAAMMEPYHRRFEFSTPAWTPGTNGPANGPAVSEPKSMEEFEAVKNRLKGAWVISSAAVTMRGPQVQVSDVYKAVSDAGILGRVFGSPNELVHTHGNMSITPATIPTDVRVVVRKSDMDAIRQALTAERKIVLTINAENIFYRGPVQVPNVIAEIPGTEKPDEVVIFGAHLDSWNGPGSEGASDNGTGTMVMLEAARILAKVGVKPKRTIRFILFAGEEQGLLGSRAYAERYAASMDKISGVFVDDGGSNYQGGVTGTEEMKEMLERAMSAMNAAFPDMPVKFNLTKNFGRGGGSDHSAFIPYGVPGFFFHESGRQNYGFVWHTQNDTFENVVPEYLIQSATNTAVMAYNLACADKLLPRVPKQ